MLSLLTITLTLVTIVLKFGLNHAFFRHYYDTEDTEHRRRIVGSTLLFLLVSSVVSTAAFYLLAPFISDAVFTSDKSRADLLRLIFFISFFEIIAVVPDSILRAHFKSAQYSILNIVAFIVQLSAITYLVIFVEASVEKVLIGRLIGSVFEAALFFFAVRRDLSLKFSMPELRGMLAFGTPLIFNQIAMTLFMMIDRFFLERYGKERDVGVYAIANTLVSVVSVLATVPFSQVWTVMRFSVMNEEGAEEYYSRVLTYITFVSMFLALGVAAVSGDGLLRFAREGYWAAATILPLLALSAVLDSACARAQHRHHAQEANHLCAHRHSGRACGQRGSELPADSQIRKPRRDHLDVDFIRGLLRFEVLGVESVFQSPLRMGQGLHDGRYRDSDRCRLLRD